MTTIYFIRHCETDHKYKDEATRPLTPKGLADCEIVTEFLQDKGVQVLASSPYKRAMDTIAPFAAQAGLEIELFEGLRERKPSDRWLAADEFWENVRLQWADFDYHACGGESLNVVQSRNIAALNEVLAKHKGKTIAVGTHGTALSTIINYFDPDYGVDDFLAMSKIMPWAVRMEFNDENNCALIEKIDLFAPKAIPDISEAQVRAVALGQLKAYLFVVVFARYGGKWLFCRAKTRDVYETAGGRIEPGETPIQAAKRELFEETGAAKFDITPAFDYIVRHPQQYSAVQVFYADIYELGDMPDYEMAEIGLFDRLPEGLRFPNITPVLFSRMLDWVFDQAQSRCVPAGELGSYHFVSVYVRYQGKWLFCRAKSRDTFETVGGHIEPGETPLQAAKRELFEETGALRFDITHAFDYYAQFPTESYNTQIFLAQIHELGALPDYEMAETTLFDALPAKLRFPNIEPVLFRYLQGWMNLNSAKDEMWDVYDENRNLTGKVHRRIDPMPEGGYHLVVIAMLQNSKDEYLITKRALTKGFPGMWEFPGGSAVAGDDSLAGVLKEVKEETGLDAEADKVKIAASYTRADAHVDIWLFKQDFDLEDVVLQEGETIDARYAKKEEILEMIKRGDFVSNEIFIELLSNTLATQ